MKAAYVVTFEFKRKPPLTARGLVSAFHPSTCTRLAMKDAHQALKPARWSSVSVRLERLHDTAELAEEAEMAADGRTP